jgi:hypothetical protein
MNTRAARAPSTAANCSVLSATSVGHDSVIGSQPVESIENDEKAGEDADSDDDGEAGDESGVADSEGDEVAEASDVGVAVLVDAGLSDGSASRSVGPASSREDEAENGDAEAEPPSEAVATSNPSARPKHASQREEDAHLSAPTRLPAAAPRS